MRPMLLLFMSMSFFSCTNGFHSPKDEEIKQAVVTMYEKRSQADGAGGWIVNEVKVLKTWKGADERHYNAEVTVKGKHTSPALAVPRPDEAVDETIVVKLIWRDGGWIGVDE